MTWENTRRILADLIKDVTCKICHKLEKNSHTHPGCDHHFCYDCVNNYILEHYECPVCNQPSFHGCADPNEPVNDVVSTISTFQAIVNHTYVRPNTDKNTSKDHTTSQVRDTQTRTNSTGGQDTMSESTNKNKGLGTTDVFKSPNKVTIKDRSRDEQNSPVVFASNIVKRPQNRTHSTDNSHIEECDIGTVNSIHRVRNLRKTEDETGYIVSKPQSDLMDYADAGGCVKKAHDGREGTDDSKQSEQTSDGRDVEYSDKRSDGVKSSPDKPITIQTNSDGNTALGTTRQLSRPQNNSKNGMLSTVSGKRKVEEMTDHANRRHSYSTTNHLIEAQQLAAQRRHKRGRESFPPGRKKLSSQEKSQRRKAFEARNAKGETKLHRAAIKGDISSVQRIVDSYLCDPNVKDNADWSPLHEACGRGYIEIMKILIQNGADVNQRGYKGKTPLHDAIDMNEIEATLLLLQNNADRTRLCDARKTPEEYCVTDAMREAIANFKESDPLPLRIPEQITTPTPADRNSAHHEQTSASSAISGPQTHSAKNTHDTDDKQNNTNSSSSSNSNNRKRERVPLSVMATAFKRRNNGPKPKAKKCTGGKLVLMQTGLETDSQLLFEKVTRRLNGHVANKFNQSVTHIIVSTDHKRRCKRTMKYLWALLNELHIVCYQWILDSEKANIWLPVEPYLVIGDRSTPNAPDRTALSTADPPSQLFYGVAFYFMENIDEDMYTPDIKNLVRLIKFGGGTNLAKPPDHHTLPKNAYAAFTICVEEDPLLQARPHTARSVSWLFDCVSYSRILEREPPDG